ncbi:M23 family metallopeptidase [Streptomyces sp. NPDC096132]|uniref:M23 family metallopeptidase n=1 Tax=Streptomyces sp. NPDC096132 TaxID=3366075 RepID=UPI0037F98023
MRREHLRAAATAGLSLLLVLLAAAPSGAEGGVNSGSGGARTTAVDAAVHAHEQARLLVERLREAGARPDQVEAAERRREDIRAGLWDLLWAAERGIGDPVVVDPSGQGGRCPVDRRSRNPHHRTGGPWTAPTRGYWLSAGYAERGARWARRHTGQDFAVPTGTPVYAVGPGTVRATTCGDGFGNQVLIRHPDGYFTQYAHLSRIDVRPGDRVSPGTRIGLSGATGNVTGPHLHFEVRITPYMGSAVAPLPWLRRKDVRLDG